MAWDINPQTAHVATGRPGIVALMLKILTAPFRKLAALAMIIWTFAHWKPDGE